MTARYRDGEALKSRARHAARPIYTQRRQFTHILSIREALGFAEWRPRFSAIYEAHGGWRPELFIIGTEAHSRCFNNEPGDGPMS